MGWTLLRYHPLACRRDLAFGATRFASGEPVGELRYRAFGATRFAGGGPGTDYRYTGQRELSEVGLYYYRARWYDAGLGRFVQADTSGSGERYAYVRNNPVRYTDPTGHRECDDFDASGRCYTAPRPRRVPARVPPRIRYNGLRQPGVSVSIEAILDRRLSQRFDPWSVPGPGPYEQSVHYGLDQIAARAYEYYDYDLQHLASTRTDNPLTRQELDAFVHTGGFEVDDPRSGGGLNITTELMLRVQSGFSTREFRGVVDTIGGLTVDHGMNYERNFLAALFETHPGAVERVCQLLREHLLDTYRQDPVGFYDEMERLDLTGDVGRDIPE